jgi:hypothetical protein
MTDLRKERDRARRKRRKAREVAATPPRREEPREEPQVRQADGSVAPQPPERHEVDRKDRPTREAVLLVATSLVSEEQGKERKR